MRVDERQAFFFETFPRVRNVDAAETQPDLRNGPVGTSRAKIWPPTAQHRTTDGLVQGGFATLDFADVFGRGGSIWNDFLVVNVSATLGPFLAFGSVELRIQPNFRTPAPVALPLLLPGLAVAVLRRPQQSY